MRIIIRSVLVYCFCLSWLSVIGQSTLPEPAPRDSTAKKAIIENANSQKLDASTDTTYQYLEGNVRLFFDSIYFYCDTAILTDYLYLAEGDVSIVKGDSIKLFSDSLRYYPDSSRAYFYGYKEGNVVLENNDTKLFTNYLIYDTDRDLMMYTNRGLLITPESKVKSGRGFFHIKNNYANFYDNVSVEGKDYTIITDSLRFYSDTKLAKFLAPVVVTQKNRRIYSDSGFYDTDDDIGEFVGNAQFVEDGKTSSADRIDYNGKTNLTTLAGNAKYRSDVEYGEADTIYYNEETEDVRLFGSAKFIDKEGNEVEGDEILYNKKSENIDVVGESVFSKPPLIIVADDLNYDQALGTAKADGHVIWQDTSSDYTIYADHIRYKEKSSNLRAFNDFGKPILENLMNKEDTLFISGDTLVAYKEAVADADTQKVFLAISDVEVLMEDMQAICDSLAYIESDGLFSLYDEPYMWSDSSQFTGDTIMIHMSNDNVDSVLLKSQAVIISTEDYQFFNQIAGGIATTYFKNEKIDKLDVQGDAKSIYYLLDDDDAYIGANQTECERIIFEFEDKELVLTRFYTENKHVLTPMDEVNHESIKVKGYNWNIDLRPTVLEDLKE